MITWRERIVAARERGAFTAEDVSLAYDWNTCAVGEQRAAMPNVIAYTSFGPKYGRPSDDQLVHLGGDNGFYLAVQRHDFDAAERYLDQIEDRALTLKREAHGDEERDDTAL